MRCRFCNSDFNDSSLLGEFFICPSCGNYFRLSAVQRVELFADNGEFFPFKSKLSSIKTGDFPQYMEKLERAKSVTGLSDSILSGWCCIGGHKVVFAVMDFAFMGGSLGKLAGDLIEDAIAFARKKRLPFVFASASGGARMQDGVASLISMSRVSNGVGSLKKRGIPFISILTDPTSGGVTASIAMLGDIILAEPNAFVGFAGPRVLKSAGYTVEEGLQSSERQFRAGFIDRIVKREELHEELVALLDFFSAKRGASIGRVDKFCRSLKGELSVAPRGWEAVSRARDYRRPTSLFYINSLFDSFIELHGDRSSADDSAIIAGLAVFNGKSSFVIAHERGTSEGGDDFRNYGMATPAGYKKALRIISMAEQFGIPLISFIDTIGADASPSSELQGIGLVIASLLEKNSQLSVPFLSLIIGQGGSGGALALTNGRDIFMQENAIFSVIMPEGCASILFGDGAKRQEAAEALGLDSFTLQKNGLVRGVIPEPDGGSSQSPTVAVGMLRGVLDAYFGK